MERRLHANLFLLCKVQSNIDSPGEAKFRLTRSRRTHPFMSENKIPEQAAAQESRSQCRDAGREFDGPQILANATIFSRLCCCFKITG